MTEVGSKIPYPEVGSRKSEVIFLIRKSEVGSRNGKNARKSEVESRNSMQLCSTIPNFSALLIQWAIRYQTTDSYIDLEINNWENEKNVKKRMKTIQKMIVIAFNSPRKCCENCREFLVEISANHREFRESIAIEHLVL